MKPETNKIPVYFYFIYLLLAFAITYLYYKKTGSPFHPEMVNSIESVSTLQTFKPYQFRLLIPAIFFLLKPFAFIPKNTLYFFYTVIIVYLILYVYYKFLSEYFRNKKVLLFITPVILYPMLWNYVILNEICQYYDFTSIFLFTLGLYYIVKEKFLYLFIVFTIAIFNKETIGYLVFAYLLFNYKNFFTKKILLNSFILISVYVLIKIILAYIFRNNPGSHVQLCMNENTDTLINLFSNRVYFKHVFFNFGGLYLFLFVLFLSGRWKMFPSRKLLFINLAFLPNIVVGYFITYYDEVRVYAEFIPLMTTIFLIYISTFSKFNLQPVKKD